MTLSGGQALATTPTRIGAEILEKLSDPPKGKLEGMSIRNLLQAGEQTGNVDALFGDYIRHDLTDEQIDAAFRAILRASGHSMLQHDLQQSKFGWSHCLTLPQAALGLSSMGADRKLALAAAFVWITAYRSVLSDQALDFGWVPSRVTDASFREALHTSPAVAAARAWHATDAELPGLRRGITRHTV